MSTAMTPKLPAEERLKALMQKDQIQALAKRNNAMQLMPPPPPPKKRKRSTTVLPEEEYVSGLEEIIARDFFPGLAETRSAQTYLDALKSRDEAQISRSREELEQIMTPGHDRYSRRGRRGTSMTPMVGRASETPRGWVGETPRTPAASEASSLAVEQPSMDTNMSLSAFQAKYISEDSEAFTQKMHELGERSREKNAWAWHNGKAPVKSMLPPRLRGVEGPEMSRDLIIATKPDASKPAAPEPWKDSGPKNALMYNAESIEDSRKTEAQVAQEKSLAPPKAINHGATRIPAPEDNRPSVPPSPSMSAVDAAIAGRPRFSGSEAGEAPPVGPQVAGFPFVDAEPTASEMAYTAQRARGQDTSDGLLKLLTSSDGRSNPFHIPETSHREKVHHRLVDRLNKGSRHDGRFTSYTADRTPAYTPTNKSSSARGPAMKRPGNLTPAAQSLLGRIGTPVRKESVWDEPRKERTRTTWSFTPKQR